MITLPPNRSITWIEFIQKVKSSQDLSHIVIADMDFYNSTLRKARLSGASIHNTSLAKTHMADADLSYATLIDVNLAGAYLRRANLQGTRFINVDLSGAHLTNADITGALFEDCNLADVVGLPNL